MSEATPAALPPETRCPQHGRPVAIVATGEESRVRGECGCEYAVRKGIPRFVPGGDYADAFGIQWNHFRRTQLDSYTGTSISRDRLARCLGGSLDPVRGASVLEVGCGAGRFTEVLLAAGARVFAVDLSSAVEANRANCSQSAGYFVCQADVLALPVAPASFDAVIALGMLQHTPSPERTVTALAEAVRPGGLLVVDHYARPPATRWFHTLAPRRILRSLFLRLPSPVAFKASRLLVRTLLPLHHALRRRGPLLDRARAAFFRVSPVFDYYDTHPELGRHLDEWAFLDTHDGLTDHYKHLRTPAEVTSALLAAGLEVLEVRLAGNGVEARARRPHTS